MKKSIFVSLFVLMLRFGVSAQSVASVFLAFEPLTGKHLVRVYPQRTKADYCRFQQEEVKFWAEADTIFSWKLCNMNVAEKVRYALACRSKFSNNKG